MAIKSNFATRILLLILSSTLMFYGTGLAQQWTDSVELQSGETKNVTTNHLLKKVIIGNPNIVDIQVVGKQEVILISKNIGHTSVILRDGADNMTKLDIFTSPDTTLLKKRISELFPGQDIKIYSNKSGVILAGTVTGTEIIEQVLRVTKQVLSVAQFSGSKSVNVGKNVRKELDRSEVAFVMGENQNSSVQVDSGDSNSAMGKSGANIVNLMTIGGPQQVLLEVKFAEVNRRSGRDLQAGFKLGKLGSDFGGAVGVNPLGGTTGDLPDLNLGDLLVNLSGLQEFGNLFINIDNFSMALQFLEEESLARILAEPRLVTQNGQEASFLAGGEYPYPVVSGNDGNVEIEWKEFGVGLKFTPIINSNGLITLKVAPSVTDIVGFVEVQDGDQPILSTRRLESTVHMRDGQTLALAGLLSENLSESVKKVPYLGDLPIIGTLFRSSTFQDNKTDLVVAVTPHIVKPVREDSISYPGEFIKTPSRFEFYLEGRLEGRRSPEDPSAIRPHNFMNNNISGGGLEGNFGHTAIQQ